MALIEARGVSHRYGERPVLRDLDVAIGEHRVGVVGANGSGKSTFARLLNGLVVPTSGTVLVDGLDTASRGREVRRRVLERHRKVVAWRILYRTVAADDGDLSPFQGRDSVTIALLQNATLPHEEYFSDVEPIFLAHGGRPHWGKLHSLDANALRTLYPRWDQFQAVRRRMDPDGLFLNAYLRKIHEGS